MATTITFDIEYRDFEAFQLYYTANDKSFGRLRLILLILMPILMIVPPLLKGNAGWQFMLPAVVFSGVWIVLFNYLFRWSMKLSAKKMYNNPANARLLMRRSMTFDSNGIAVKSESADIKFAWDDIAEVGETNEYFFVFTGSHQGYIVPKRHLTEVQTAELEALCDANDKLIQPKNKNK